MSAFSKLVFDDVASGTTANYHTPSSAIVVACRSGGVEIKDVSDGITTSLLVMVAGEYKILDLYQGMRLEIEATAANTTCRIGKWRWQSL